MGDNVCTLAAVAPKKIRFNFWMDPAQRKGLQVVKARDGVPESEQVRRAIAQWLKDRGVSLSAAGAKDATAGRGRGTARRRP